MGRSASPDDTVFSQQGTWKEGGRRGYEGFITATNVFEEEAGPILAAGCHATFNYFADAGYGFAKHSWDALTVSERAD